MLRSFFCALILAGCVSGYPVADPDATTNQNVDSDQHQPGDTTTTIEVCSVEIVFNFDRQVVSFYNHNDQIVIVEVLLLNETGEIEGTVVENYLWNDGVDTESATFDHGDILEITIYWLELDLQVYSECDTQVWQLG